MESNIRLLAVRPELRERAKALMGLLIATVVLDAIAVVSGLAELKLLTGLAGGDVAAAAAVESSDRRQEVIELVHFALFITMGIFWLRWFHRAYRDLEPLGATGLRFPAPEALWSWFLPGFNLIRPKQIANDIWRASDPEGPMGEAWKKNRVSALMHAWWLFAVLSVAAGFVGFRGVRSGENVREILAGSWFSVGGDLAGMVAAILAVSVVEGITRRLEQRADRLRTSELRDF